MSHWLADDPELLHATLAILDAWDEDGSTMTPAVTLSSEQDETEHGDSPDDEVLVGPTVSSRRSADRQSSRSEPYKPATNQRRRQEISVLRAQVQALEAQVQAIHAAGELKRTHQQRNTERGLLAARASLWQGVAANQLRLRRQAELDQTKLRTRLRTHMSIAQGMLKLMRKARDVEDADTTRLLHQHTAPATLEHPMPRGDQFERVELIYANMQDVFAHPIFHNGTSPFVDVEIAHDLDREIVLAFRESWTVPFEPLDVLNALWAFTRKRYEVKWRMPGSQVLLDTDDSFVSQFNARGAIDSCEYAFIGQLVLKQFTECANGHVPAIVTSMYSTPTVKEAHDHALQVWMQENSCLRVLPLVSSSSGQFPSTQVQCSYHVSVKFNDDDAVTGRHHAGALTNFVLDRLQSDVDVKRNSVESSLLQAPRRALRV